MLTTRFEYRSNFGKMPALSKFSMSIISKKTKGEAIQTFIGELKENYETHLLLHKLNRHFYVEHPFDI
jgi:hypothetical protein